MCLSPGFTTYSCMIHGRKGLVQEVSLKDKIKKKCYFLKFLNLFPFYFITA